MEGVCVKVSLKFQIMGCDFFLITFCYFWSCLLLIKLYGFVSMFAQSWGVKAVTLQKWKVFPFAYFKIKWLFDKVVLQCMTDYKFTIAFIVSMDFVGPHKSFKNSHFQGKMLWKLRENLNTR